MDLQEEMEKLAKRGFEVTVSCGPVYPDKRMRSKGFGFVTNRFSVSIGLVDQPIAITEGCFNEFERAMKSALKRIEKDKRVSFIGSALGPDGLLRVPPPDFKTWEDWEEHVRSIPEEEE